MVLYVKDQKIFVYGVSKYPVLSMFEGGDQYSHTHEVH